MEVKLWEFQRGEKWQWQGSITGKGHDVLNVFAQRVDQRWYISDGTSTKRAAGGPTQGGVPHSSPLWLEWGGFVSDMFHVRNTTLETHNPQHHKIANYKITNPLQLQPRQLHLPIQRCPRIAFSIVRRAAHKDPFHRVFCDGGWVSDAVCDCSRPLYGR